MTHPAVHLAEFSSTLELDRVPHHVREAASRSLLDIIGVAIRGRRHPVAVQALNAAARLPGAQGSGVVWGADVQLNASAAALANGVAAHVDDFDDTHSDGIVHGSAVITPVAVALASECNASGGELLCALIAGWEVAARVGLASRGSFHARGFHTTSIAGVFGAAAAAARILRLSPSQTAHAIGLAGSQAAGINEYLSNSSSAKAFHCGWSAHAGLVSAIMAQAGMTGPQSVFEGRDGLLRAYGLPERVRPSALDTGLGSVWETSNISIKPYPCCHFAHAFVDCAGNLLHRGIRPEFIESIMCVVPETEVPLICEPFEKKLRPSTPYAAKFSLPFLLAARLIDGTIDHDTFGELNIRRKELLDFAQQVRYRLAGADETSFPSSFPGWLEVSLHDGTRITERIDINFGHPKNPMTFEQVVEKFQENTAATLGEGRARKVVAIVGDIANYSTRQLAAALKPAV